MKVQIQMLKRVPRLRERMRRDGWKLEFQNDESLVACHPQVQDSDDARQRLDRLGLLTSQAMRIHFSLTTERAEDPCWEHDHE